MKAEISYTVTGKKRIGKKRIGKKHIGKKRTGKKAHLYISA